MRHHMHMGHGGRTWLQEDESREPFASRKDQAERQAFVKELHLLKTDIFMRMVESGMMPLRPGVQRLVGAALTGSPAPL